MYVPILAGLLFGLAWRTVFIVGGGGLALWMLAAYVAYRMLR